MKTKTFLFLLLITISVTIIDITSLAKAKNITPSTLGNYPNTTVQLSGNTSIVPNSLPVNAVSITGTTSSNFKGNISVNSVTGIVQITNAYPTGTYTISVNAFDNENITTTKTFTLTVQTPVSCNDTKFKQAPTFDVSQGPQSIATEDFDGDGKQDVVTTSMSSSVSILRNTGAVGAENFAPKVDFGITSGALGLAVADFDGDGRQDIVTANYFTPDISVLRNISSGIGNINFAAKVDFNVATDPRSVAIADFDGDGKLDIVVANSGSNSISILKNTSNAIGIISFAPAVNFSVGLRPRSVAVGDLDGDGKTDIATANYFSDSVSVLRNIGTGTISFAPKIDFAVGSIPGSSPASLVIVDFDGDNKLDVAVANNFSNSVSVLKNNAANIGTISFAAKINFSAGWGPYAIIAADIDDDGKKDLATANYYGDTISVLRNASNSNAINFEFRREYTVNNTPTSIAYSDFNGDDKVDFVISNSKSNNVSFLKNTGTGVGAVQFDSRLELGVNGLGTNAFSIAVGDFNSDGKQDLVTANYAANNITIFRNQGAVAGSTKFSSAIEFTVGTNSSPYWILVKDLDGDGKQDIVTANSSSSSISVLRNTSTSQEVISFAPRIDFAVGNNPRFIGVGDFDNDGKFDIASANFDSNNISVLRNVSSGIGTISFAPKVDFAVNTSVQSLVITDINADGKSDIAVTNRYGTTISVFRNSSANRGTISFATKLDFTVNSQPLFITAEDFDGDGKQDIAVTNYIQPNGIVSILRNISTNGDDINFAPKVDYPITAYPEFNMIPGHIVTGDLNNDTKADIIVINSALQTISLLKNSSQSTGNISFEPKIDIVPSKSALALAIADFNQDGKQDISISKSNNIDILESPCNLNQERRFDFDGDGKTDVSIFRPSVGEWWYLKSSTGGNGAFQFGSATDKMVPADFTGDGKSDFAFFRPSTGEWFVLRSEDSSFYSFPFGTNGDIPIPADYDSDGKADAAVFRPSTNTWYIFKSTGGTSIQTFGQAEDVPVVADYDGDSKADIAIYRPSKGEWWIQRSSLGAIAFQFGTSTDKPVQADYTGDGKADVAFWRPQTGEWFVLRSENQSFYSFPFGTSGDIATPGDYDGDGKTDAAVFRPSNNTWFIQRTTSGTLIQTFGQSGDKPVPNAFVP